MRADRDHDHPALTPRLERAMVDLIGGHDGGWSLWLAALAQLEDLVAESRADGHHRFDHYPHGEFRRFKIGLQNVLERAALAVEIRQLITNDFDGASSEQLREEIADVLLERAREHADGYAHVVVKGEPPTRERKAEVRHLRRG